MFTRFFGRNSGEGTELVPALPPDTAVREDPLGNETTTTSGDAEGLAVRTVKLTIPKAQRKSPPTEAQLRHTLNSFDIEQVR
jgi:hypothetical protein